MAFSYGKLTDPIAVVGSVPQVLYLGLAGTRTYIASVELHNWDTNNTNRTVLGYLVPAAGSNVPGVGAQASQMFRATIASLDTFFLEPKYPYVLSNPGDSLQVVANGTGINAIVKGGTE